MVCPLCGYGSNPPGARFCAGCGRLLDDRTGVAAESRRPEPAGVAGGAAAPRPASPWVQGSVGETGPGDGDATRPISSGSAESPTGNAGRLAAGPTKPGEPAGSTRPGGPAAPPNGRSATTGEAAGSPRAGAGPKPGGEPRRERPRPNPARGGGRPAGPSPGEPLGLPPGMAALASSSRAWAVAAPVSALIAGFMSGIPALFGVLGADIGARAGLGGLPAILGPLLVWQLRQKDDPFSAQHGLNALNFNLTVLTLAFGLTLFTTLTWGVGALFAVPAGIALVAGWLVCSAIAASRASKGQPYRYPLSFRFVRNP